MSTFRAACTAILVCALITSVVGTTGCTSMHRAPFVTPAAQPVVWRLKPGNKIRVSLRDGRQIRLTVKSVDGTGIVGDDDTRVELTDIMLVEQRRFSGVKTTLLVVGFIGGLWLLGEVAERVLVFPML